MEEKFTVAEFKNYVTSRDSLGDVLYFLNADNIRKANESKEDTEEGEEVVRDVRFPSTEEMHCPKCQMPTPHSLSGDDSFKTKEGLWTCTMPGCGHQLS